MPLKLAMLGTGTFALPTFRALLDSEHVVAALVTQPDRTGRGHHRHVNPLKELAVERGVAVFQPPRIKRPEAVERLREFEVDLYVTAAYGQLLSEAVLNVPRLGAINLHGSLLPKYRGAAPVQRAVMAGETRTGVTAFQITLGMDEGPMLGTVATDIESAETAGQLHDRLADLAAPLAVRVVGELAAGTALPQPQDESLATHAAKLTKADGVIDWTRPSRLVDAQIRGVQPWPKARTWWTGGDKRTELLVTSVRFGEGDAAATPGTILSTDPLRVACGSGVAVVEGIQPPGKRAMSGTDFTRGYPIAAGHSFTGNPAGGGL